MTVREELRMNEINLTQELEKIARSRQGFDNALKSLGRTRELEEEFKAIEYAHSRVVEALQCVRRKLFDLNHLELFKDALLRKVAVILDTLHTDGGYYTDFHHDFVKHRFFGVYLTLGDQVRVVPLRPDVFEMKHLVFSHLQVAMFSVRDPLRMHSALYDDLGEYARRLAWYNESHRAAYDNVQFVAVVDAERLDFVSLMHGQTIFPPVAPDLP